MWHSETDLSAKEASKLYLRLCKQESVPAEQHGHVAAFHSELCGRYPEIDTLPEEEVDTCPWSYAHDKPGFHVIMCLNYGGELEIASQFVMDLAAKHGLVCFDPQGPNVYLPPDLKPGRSRFRFW